MSNRHLRRLIRWIAFSLSAYAILLIAAYVFNVGWVEILKSLIPVVLAVPAALLAGAFQRRTSYLQALRDYWKQVVPAVQCAIQYTYLQAPDQATFTEVINGLATAIDLTRGVFCNLKASEGSVGLYPFENLKDIHLIINWLGYEPNHYQNHSDLARKCIRRLWKEVHAALLSEFDRDEPIVPVSKYLHQGFSIADLLVGGVLQSIHLERGQSPSNPTLLPKHSSR